MPDHNTDFIMFLFKGFCGYCKQDVAIFDPEKQIYYFHNIVPNLIG